MTQPSASVAPSAVCWDCLGTCRTENAYFHRCDGPLCQADTPEVECVTCDGRGFLVDAY